MCVYCCSNDVRRFDDGISFWLFVWAGPLEAALVLLMVSLELGFVPAVCGMAAMLAVIPIQVKLRLACSSISLLSLCYSQGVCGYNGRPHLAEVYVCIACRRCLCGPLLGFGATQRNAQMNVCA